VQLNLAFSIARSTGGPLGESLSASLGTASTEPARCAALEIRRAWIARMVAAAANEESQNERAKTHGSHLGAPCVVTGQ